MKTRSLLARIPRRVIIAAITSLVLLTLVAAVAGQSHQPNTTNRLHMYSKPAVVRIISGYVGQFSWNGRQWNVQDLSSGSGFIINPNGYILTNAHVTSDIKEGDDGGRRKLLIQLAVQALQAYGKPVNQQSVIEGARFLSTAATLTSFRRINYVFLQSGRQFPYEIKAFGAPTGEGKDLPNGKDVSVIKIEIKNAPTLKLGNSDDTQVGDKVWVIGYPGAADSETLDAKSQLEPTTNGGEISAKKTSQDGAPILQTNASTTHGNSGGPAINEKGEVVGLLTFRGNTVNGQEVQGFNFIVPTNTAMEFVRQAGTENTASPVDGKWREGLEHYWAQEYSSAQGDFSSVLALFPDHSEAQKLISDGQEHIAKGEDRSGAGIVGGIIIVVLGGGFIVVVGGIVALVLISKKKKRVGGALPAGRPYPQQQPMGYQQQPQPNGDFQPSPIPGRQPVAAPQGGHQQTVRFNPNQMTDIFQATAKLTCTSGPLKGQEFPIGQGFYIGRDASRAQVVVDDTQVSGQHLWIGPIDGHFVARDNHSTNGTYLNRQLTERITEVQLNNNDVLTLGAAGTVKFVFHP